MISRGGTDGIGCGRGGNRSNTCVIGGKTYSTGTAAAGDLGVTQQQISGYLAVKKALEEQDG
ncbi:MAG: hypothetical protein AAGF55_01100 [Pseudomonadota bacterium]